MENNLPDMKRAEDRGWQDMQRQLDAHMPLAGRQRRRPLFYWGAALAAACVLLFLGTLAWTTDRTANDWSETSADIRANTVDPEISEPENAGLNIAETAIKGEQRTNQQTQPTNTHNAPRPEGGQPDRTEITGPQNSTSTGKTNPVADAPAPGFPDLHRPDERVNPTQKFSPYAYTDPKDRTFVGEGPSGNQSAPQADALFPNTEGAMTGMGERTVLTERSMPVAALQKIGPLEWGLDLQSPEFTRRVVPASDKVRLASSSFVAAHMIHGPSASIGATISLGKSWTRPGSRWSAEGAVGYRYQKTYMGEQPVLPSQNRLDVATYYVNETETQDAFSNTASAPAQIAYLKDLHYATASVGADYRLNHKLSAYLGGEISGLLTVRRADDSFGGGLLARDGLDQDAEVTGLDVRGLDERVLRSFDFAVGTGLKLDLGYRFALTGRYHLGLVNLFEDAERSLYNHRAELGVRYRF